MTAERLHLRSYRLAFELERRIHRIDRFRIPVPYGLPLAAVGWWFGCVVGVLLVGRVPGLGPLLAVLPWPVRLILVPAAAARLLCVVGSDGRPAYERLVARVRFVVAPQRVVAFERRRPRPCQRLADVAVGGDERDAHLRPAKVRGAGPVLIARPARGHRRRGRVRIVATEDRWLTLPQELALPVRSRLEIACARR